MKKPDSNPLNDIATKVVSLLRTYSVFLFILVSLAIFGYLVLTIRTLANTEPSESAIAEKSGQEKSTTIDQSSIERIQQLQQQSVDVRTLLNQGRNNPFQE